MMVSLGTVQDLEYLFSLIPQYEYNTLDEERARKEILERGKFFWKVDDVGVMYVTHTRSKDKYMLHGYGEKMNGKNMMRMIRAAKEVTDYMLNNWCNELYACTDVRNLASIKGLKRIGYNSLREYDSPKDGRLVELRRNRWHF